MTVKTPAPQQVPRQTPHAPLSAARAFVVQFRDETVGGDGFSGRVEHMMTGHAARFEAPEELLAFFASVLRAEPPKDSQEG